MGTGTSASRVRRLSMQSGVIRYHRLVQAAIQAGMRQAFSKWEHFNSHSRDQFRFGRAE